MKGTNRWVYRRAATDEDQVTKRKQVKGSHGMLSGADTAAASHCKTNQLDCAKLLHLVRRGCVAVTMGQVLRVATSFFFAVDRSSNFDSAICQS